MLKPAHPSTSTSTSLCAWAQGDIVRGVMLSEVEACAIANI